MDNISVKVDRLTATALRRLAKIRNESRSEVIRAAISALAEASSKDAPGNAFERIKHLAGCVASAGTASATGIGEQFAADLVRARRRTRR